MRVKAGDTLQITRLGFLNNIIVFNSTNFDTKEKIRIVMRIRSYELNAIDVRAYRLRERKTAPFTLKRTDNITIDMGKIHLDPIPFYSSGTSVSPGLGMLMPVGGIPIPDMKQIRRQEQLDKIAALEKKDMTRRYIDYKYNKRLVYKVTGLAGNELENFMNYCRPTDKQIIEANDYDLVYHILNCYQQFREDND